VARRQGFDRDEVVRAARTLFWARGYEAASIPELEAATGIRRSSLYNTFGSKRGLFDAAVQSYLDEVIRPRLRPLQDASVAPGGLADYLTGLRAAFERLDSMPAQHGCLLVNTAGAPIADDAQVARVIADYRAELATAFDRGIRAAHPAIGTEELCQRREAITALVVAAFALARVDAEQAVRSIDAALRLQLDGAASAHWA